MTVSAMPAAATMPAAAMPVGMSGRRGQQTGGYWGRDQQSFEAHHGYHPFVSVDREDLDNLKR
jgi:hypothetical protein